MAAKDGTRATPPTAGTTVAGLLRRRPATAKVFLDHGMACVGCSLAAFDTLADAAREYRLPLAGFLDELAAAKSRTERVRRGPAPRNEGLENLR